MSDDVAMTRPAIGGSGLILRSTALREGMNSYDVQRMRRSRQWVALRPGAYIDASVKPDQFQQHLLLIEAIAPQLRPDAVFSHVSAACLHGLPVWGASLRAVQLTRPDSGGCHRRRSQHVFGAAFGEDEVDVVAGYRVTTRARTLIDLCRFLSLEAAVVAVDRWLRAGLTTREELIRAIERYPKRPGMRRAHRAVVFGDSLSESVGESRSRLKIHEAGLPAPGLQFVVRDLFGTVAGRSDYVWEEFRTVGEFDGAQKYGRLLRAHESAGDIVFKEKLREQAITDANWQVVRWIWEELDDFASVAVRIRRAFERGLRQQNAGN